MKKIAFDFDGTLEFEDIQKLAKKLIDMGHIVEIVTTRWDEDNKHKYPFFNIYTQEMKDNIHSELYAVAKKLNIPFHFTNMQWKWEFLKNNGFDVLIDDNYYDEKPLVEKVGIRFISAAFNNKAIKKFIKELEKDGKIQD